MSPTFLAASEAESRLLPGGTFRGPTPYVIAIMTFVMMIVAAAGLALANAAGVVGSAVEHKYILQLSDSRSGKVERAVAVARSVRGVTDVQAVPEEQMRRTLERWIGPGGLGEDLPVPAIIHIELAQGANADATGALLQRAAPGSRFIAEKATVQPLLGSLRALRWLAASLVILMAAATSAAVVLATRSALDNYRSTIDIMHGIGATDGQIARLFQRKIALDALVGAIAGAAIAAIALLVVGGGGSALARDVAGTVPLRRGDLILLAMMPLAAALLATLVARAAVLSALRMAP